MSTPRDDYNINLAVQRDPGLRRNMLKHGLIQRLVDNTYILTAKGEHELSKRDSHLARFEATGGATS